MGLSDDRLHAHLREIILGLNDGLTATIGLVAGLSAGGQGHASVLIGGLAAAGAAAISMAGGQFLADRAEGHLRARPFGMAQMVRNAAYMFAAVWFGALLVLWPSLFSWRGAELALGVPSGAAASLFLGWWAHAGPPRVRLKQGLWFMAVTLLATAMGTALGMLANRWLVHA